ncbi:MAG TPA: biopolymer transporter ExbD [Thermodesulfobacteriota bacterium]|nr:biopolymer transporter ExbD [Thermodesulfobacteriota bacterium]
MKFRNGNEKKARFAAAVDLTPIVDTVFNLLIFFALSLNFAATSGGINVRLPKAATAEPIKAEQLTISLTKDDKLYLNDKTISLDELSKTLEKNRDKESLVIIRADNAVPHGRVVEVMDMVKTQGFSRLAIGVEQASPERK